MHRTSRLPPPPLFSSFFFFADHEIRRKASYFRVRIHSIRAVPFYTRGHKFYYFQLATVNRLVGKLQRVYMHMQGGP